MGLEIVTAKVSEAEKDLRNLSDKVSGVSDRVYEIDKRLQRVEDNQTSQGKTLDKILSLFEWCIKGVLGALGSGIIYLLVTVWGAR